MPPKPSPKIYSKEMLVENFAHSLSDEPDNMFGNDFTTSVKFIQDNDWNLGSGTWADISGERVKSLLFLAELNRAVTKYGDTKYAPKSAVSVFDIYGLSLIVQR